MRPVGANPFGGVKQGMPKHRSLQAGILVLIAVLTLLGMGRSPDTVIVLAAGACLIAIVLLMWADDGPSILLLPCAYQWSEVAVKPILTAIESRPIADFADFGGDLHAAALFGFAAILPFAAGLRFAFGRAFNGRLAGLRDFVTLTPGRTIIAFSCAMIIFGMLADLAEPFSGPARQIILGFAVVKNVGVFLLTFWSLHTRRGYFWLAAVLAFQIVIGMTGFFAEFRNTLLAALIGTLCARPVLRPFTVILSLVSAALVLLIGAFWSAYKPAYRDWANNHTGAQSVDKPLDERIGYLSGYAERFGPDEFGYGLNALLMRHSYIDFLSATLENVPKNIPHEGGARLSAAVVHTLMPRVLFTDKAVLENDTDVTIHYTGASITADGVTSISIGYLGELYIDFGYYGALIAAGGIGAFVGGLLRLFNGRDKKLSFAYATSIMAAIPLAAFGTALIKLVGGVVMGLIVMFVFHRFVAPYLLALSSSLVPRRRQRSLMYLSE